MFALDPSDLVHWTEMLVNHLFLLLMLLYLTIMTMMQIPCSILMAPVMNMPQLALKTCLAFQVTLMCYTMDRALGWDLTAVVLTLLAQPAVFLVQLQLSQPFQRLFIMQFFPELF
jgi:hypothetical protein